MGKRLFIAALAGLLIFFAAARMPAQEVVDKTVATVGDGVSSVELITYSDLLWQLALQLGSSLSPPSSDELNSALRTLIDQRLYALEAKRLPRNTPTDAEVDAEIERVVKLFPPGEFERRLRFVGFSSVRDENFRRIMEQRVAIEKYIDFRFRSFVIITADEEARYYRNFYVPEFRRLNPGAIVPELNEARPRINETLTESKVEGEIQKFLDEAKSRAEIEILFEV